jgi:hypothetical protein
MPPDDKFSTFWLVDSLSKFHCVAVHSRTTELKYLTCLDCYSTILGFQIIKRPDEIYVACDRVELKRD